MLEKLLEEVKALHDDLHSQLRDAHDEIGRLNTEIRRRDELISELRVGSTQMQGTPHWDSDATPPPKRLKTATVPRRRATEVSTPGAETPLERARRRGSEITTPGSGRNVKGTTVYESERMTVRLFALATCPPLPDKSGLAGNTPQDFWDPDF
ncbi:MAG: hypothetical protein KVP17_003244 [Porospora cf. gigantea B]|uniref:uncharacterized protein n=1 Tax=Porospora cf. gigantea B TaxID=2853592 RepID=UPI0035719FDD|nr:MAG: hypothetical protein KVP17_003244 [Porospora cf. gigantea B]